jgi:hypothetical protein
VATVTGWLLEHRLDDLMRGLKAANKQAVKVGATLLTVRRTGRSETRVVRSTENYFGETTVERACFIEVEVAGEVPVLPGGWTLLAVVDHREGAPIVKHVPGRDLPAGQRERGPLCDHCHKERRRAETFVLQGCHEGTVETLQVGRQCLADFLGVAGYSPAALLALATFLAAPTAGLDADRDGFEGGFARGRTMIEVLQVVRVAGACISENGWLSKGKAQETGTRSTADDVASLLWPPRERPAERSAWAKKVAERQFTLAARDEARAAIAWAAALLGDADDYRNNLGVCASREAVGADKLGIVVSLMATYRREQDRLRERTKAAATSAHVGMVEERLVLDLTLAALPKAFPNAFGTSYRCEFTDPEGRAFVWWASNDPTHDAEGWRTGERATGPSAEPAPWNVGETRRVKATVKKHEEWQGVKRTVVTRVKPAAPAKVRA